MLLCISDTENVIFAVVKENLTKEGNEIPEKENSNENESQEKNSVLNNAEIYKTKEVNQIEICAVKQEDTETIGKATTMPELNNKNELTASLNSSYTQEMMTTALPQAAPITIKEIIITTESHPNTLIGIEKKQKPIDEVKQQQPIQSNPT